MAWKGGFYSYACEGKNGRGSVVPSLGMAERGWCATVEVEAGSDAVVA
jgi:hypothetical protein